MTSEIGYKFANKAMVTGPDKFLELLDIATPEPGPGQILVEISYVAQNPTDGKSCYRIDRIV
jgi:NADPH:quinone reductase-like Zn-dependent oxidoreductase